jgi:phosphoserine phosphatase
MDQYRVDETGNIFKHVKEQRAYIHVGRILPGETKAQALKRVKEAQEEQDLAESSGYADAAREYQN